MSRFILVLIIILFSNLTNANPKLDSLLNVLDERVKNKDVYTNKREARIRGLKKQLNDTAIDALRFDLNGLLFHQYSSFQTDSAYQIAMHRMEIANKDGSRKNRAIALMNVADVMRTAGMFKETLDVLAELRRDDLYKEDINYYYNLYHTVYLLMVDYSLSDKERKKYQALVYNYKDTILHHSEPDSFNYNTILTGKKISQGLFDEALTMAEDCVSRKDEEGYHPGIINHILSVIYRQKGDVEKEKYYLAVSAISDIEAGVKEYISLHSLAMILYNEGDSDRAYLYVKCAMEDAIFCNAPLRTLEVSRMLPIINGTYDVKNKHEKERLLKIIIVASSLAVILVLTLLYTYKQVKTLSSIRRYHKNVNIELKKINAELNDVNGKLLDSNLVKEEYIGQMFNLCSSYINKLEDFRTSVNRKVKTGKFEDLNKMVASTSLVDHELKEFYKNFDSIFLSIYPTFVDEFNALLKPDSQITTKDGELLNTELRIFALVRLGINDSVKIAELLRYSPQTIYNYRQKIRNTLQIEKGNFMDELAKIGRKQMI